MPLGGRAGGRGQKYIFRATFPGSNFISTRSGPSCWHNATSRLCCPYRPNPQQQLTMLPPSCANIALGDVRVLVPCLSAVRCWWAGEQPHPTWERAAQCSTARGWLGVERTEARARQPAATIRVDWEPPARRNGNTDCPSYPSIRPPRGRTIRSATGTNRTCARQSPGLRLLHRLR